MSSTVWGNGFHRRRFVTFRDQCALSTLTVAELEAAWLQHDNCSLSGHYPPPPSQDDSALPLAS
jgi:hypothetical protein